MRLEEILDNLGTHEGWDERGDGYWLEDPRLDVERMGRAMVGAGARLVTITGRPSTESECSLAYHWDLGGDLITLITSTRGGKVPSLAPTCPAADWIEREIHDYFAVQFSGRADLPPLVLRSNDPPGMFRWGPREGGQQ